jgi:sugar porter (SP) family MFS transporter
VEAFPAAIFFCLLFLTPRSPRWLVSKGRSEEAGRVLLALGHVNADQELAAIQAAVATDASHRHVPLFQSRFRKPNLLAIAIAAFNQLSGINAILYYSKRIFEMAGAGESAALLNSVGIGMTNLVFTMAALLVIDKFGRRKLMLIGSIGYLLSLGATSWAFYTYGTAFDGVGSHIVLGSLVLFIASHAFGQGAVIWVFISEIFPNAVRARGQALGSSTHWIMAAAISWTFPMFAEQSGGHTFAFYTVMMALQLIWVLRVMPETKGVPLEQIQKKLGIE